MAPPAVVPVHPGLFTLTDPPQLLGGRCHGCGAHHFPRHDTCPYCAADDTEAAALSPHGLLWAWTAVVHPPPGYRGTVPYGFGVVELPEGLRVVTRLTEADPRRLRIDQPMHLVLDRLCDDDAGQAIVTYAFAPDAAEDAAAQPSGNRR